MQEFGEWVYPTHKEYIFERMDYVALGHWHGFGRVGKHENVFYSGSLERTSLNDKRNSKGYALVTLNEQLKVEYKEIRIRPIVSKSIDCENYESSLKHLDASDTNDAIVEITLQNLSTMQSIDIQNKEIKALFPDAMSVSVKRVFKKDANEAMHLQDVQALSLQEYFLDHIKEQSSDKEFVRLKPKIQELFSKYEEAYDDTL